MSRDPAEIGQELRESVATEKKLRQESDETYKHYMHLDSEADEEKERGDTLRKQLLDAVAPEPPAPPPPGPPDPPVPPHHRPLA